MADKPKNLGIRATPEKQKRLKQWALNHDTTVQGLFDQLTDGMLGTASELNQTTGKKHQFVILRANHALGGYDERIEDWMRFVTEFFPELTEDEEKFIKRMCQALRFNIEITVRGEARAETNQEDNANQPNDDVTAEVRKAEAFARGDNPGAENPKRSRKKA